MAIEFLNDVEIGGSLKATGPLKDSGGDNGTSGQVLSSTGTGTNWVDASDGDITSVVAGTNLNGGGTTGDVTLNLDSTLNITNCYTTGVVGANNSQSRDKLRVWISNAFAIGMVNGFSYGGLNDYAMTFQMSNNATRGFWWGDNGHSNSQGAMSLTTEGKLAVANSMRLGYGQSNTVTPGIDATLEINGSLALSSYFKDKNGSVGNNGDFLVSTATGGVVWAANPVKYSAVSDNLILAATTATSVGGSTFAPYVLLAESNPGVTNGEVKKIRLGSISLDRFNGTFGVNTKILLSRSVNSSGLNVAPVYVDNTLNANGEMYNYASDVSSPFGSRHFGFAINGTITGSISQGFGAVAYNTTNSDERLKKNIETWEENILEKFEKVKPKEFNFLTDAEDADKTKGYIAQEMVDSFPEAYPLDYSEENYYNYNPSGMVVYLTKAIKELIDKNKELEDRIQKLENK